MSQGGIAAYLRGLFIVFVSLRFSALPKRRRLFQKGSPRGEVTFFTIGALEKLIYAGKGVKYVRQCISETQRD